MNPDTARFPLEQAAVQTTYQEPANRWHAWLLELRCLTGFRWIRPKMVTRTRTLIQVPSGLLEYPGKLTEQEADDIKRRWEAAYAKGSQLWHRIEVLPPDSEPEP